MSYSFVFVEGCNSFLRGRFVRVVRDSRCRVGGRGGRLLVLNFTLIEYFFFRLSVFSFIKNFMRIFRVWYRGYRVYRYLVNIDGSDR